MSHSTQKTLFTSQREGFWWIDFRRFNAYGVRDGKLQGSQRYELNIQTKWGCVEIATAWRDTGAWP